MNSNLKVILQRTVTMFMHLDFTCFTATTRFVANYIYCKNAILQGLPDVLQYYMGGLPRPPNCIT